MIRRTTRAGLTLTEVLVAMFVMALGMISLLTLFPLGAMQIGDALRMDRATQTATSADAILRMHWRHTVIPQVSNGGRPNDPFIWDAMDDPNLVQQQPDPANPGLILNQYVPQFIRLTGGIASASWGNPDPNPISTTSLMLDTGNPASVPNPGPPLGPYMQLNMPTAHGRPGRVAPNPSRMPSFPIMIDPIGAIARAGRPGQFWVGGNSQATVGATLTSYPRFLIPRRVPRFVFLGNFSASSQLTSNFFIMSDDLSFEKNGAPDPGGTLNRQGRYNWAAIIQRPQYDNRLVADLKILVFDGRAPGVAGPEDEQVITLSWQNTNPQPVPDPTQPVAPTPLYLVPGQKSIALLLPARGTDSPALIRRGGWIMDGTSTVDATNGLFGPRSIRNANFYRIVGVQAAEEGTGPNNTTPYLIDLETPIVGPTTVAGTEPPAMIYLFANLTEVFERPALRLDQGN